MSLKPDPPDPTPYAEESPGPFRGQHSKSRATDSARIATLLSCPPRISIFYPDA